MFAPTTTCRDFSEHTITPIHFDIDETIVSSFGRQPARTSCTIFFPHEGGEGMIPEVVEKVHELANKQGIPLRLVLQNTFRFANGTMILLSTIQQELVRARVTLQDLSSYEDVEDVVDATEQTMARDRVLEYIETLCKYGAEDATNTLIELIQYVCTHSTWYDERYCAGTSTKLYSILSSMCSDTPPIIALGQLVGKHPNMWTKHHTVHDVPQVYGLDEKDVELIISQTGAIRERCITALQKQHGDLIEAIIDIESEKYPV